MLATGTLLQGRYLITRPIGRGGMAAVYEAVDARLQNTVAVKQMTAIDGESDRAFEREAQLLAGLRHHALPVVIDYFIDSNGHYLVMQYIDGEDLAHALHRAGGACDPDEVRAWALAVLETLAYLHEHQPPVVHRDIKPANLKRTPAGEIVLLDFGLAKGHAAPRPQTTDDRSVFGYTLHYAPPEQLEWRPTDARSDIYALGATLYHLLTGVAPPSAHQRISAVRGGLPDPLSPPSVINPRVDAGLSRAVVGAMALSAADRYQSAAAMRAALAGAAGSPTRRKPRGRVRANRRVDVAMASQVEVGRLTDLLVQVRFPRSPLLGLEDWPTRHKPPRIEQATESVNIAHAADPKTGETLPARLRIRVIAPDFTIEGQSDFTLDVPSNDYSKRLAILLTPQHAGLCRVNVEVHGTDAAFLGLIPIETEVVSHPAPDRTVQPATMLLGGLRREVVEAVRRDGGELPTNLLEGEEPTALGHSPFGSPEPDGRVRDRSRLKTPPMPRMPLRARLVGAASIASAAGVIVLAGSLWLRSDPRSIVLPPIASSRSTAPSQGSAPATESAPAMAAPSIEDAARRNSAALPPPATANDTPAATPSPATSAGGSMAKRASPLAPAAEFEFARERSEALADSAEATQARADVEKALRALSAAYSMLDLDAIRQVYPTAPDSVQKALNSYQSLSRKYVGEFRYRSLDVRAGRAVVEVEEEQEVRLKAGPTQRGRFHATFELMKRDERWIVVKSAYVPTKMTGPR